MNSRRREQVWARVDAARPCAALLRDVGPLPEPIDGPVVGR